MAAVTLLRRATSKAHTTSVLEADTALIGGLELSAAGTGSLYNDGNTTQIDLGTGGALTTVNLGTGSAVTSLNLGTGMGSGDTINIGGASSTTVVAGDLDVQGTTTSVNSEVVNISDNHLYLNADYTAESAQTGGLVINYDPDATVADTEAAGGFTAATTVATTAASVFAAGEFVQVSGAANQANDGIYEVLSHAGNVLTIDSTPVHSFAQTAFTVDATGSTAAFTRVNVAVLQTKTDGTFQVGNGNTAGSLTSSFQDLSTGGALTWANVLSNGATSGGTNPTLTSGDILLGAAELTLASGTGGDNAVSLTSGNNGAGDSGDITIDVGTASGTTGTINLGVTNATDVNVGGGGTLDLGGASGGAATFDSAGTITIGANATGTTIAGGSATGTVTIGNSSAGAVAVTSGAAANVTGGASSTITVAGSSGGTETLTLSATNGGAGEGAVAVTAEDGDITFDALAMTTPITLNQSGDLDLNATFSGAGVTSIIGALNGLQDGTVSITGVESDSLTADYATNGRAVGEVVIINANDTATTQADASALSTCEGLVGAVETVGTLGTGKVTTHGTAVVLFENGVSTPAAGDPIYVSEVAGRVTGTAPSGTIGGGVVVYQVGFLKDDSTLTAVTVGTDETAEIHLSPVLLTVL